MEEVNPIFDHIFIKNSIPWAFFDERGGLISLNHEFLELFGSLHPSELKKINLFNDFKLDDEISQKLQKGQNCQYEILTEFKALPDSKEDQCKKKNLSISLH